MIKNKLDFNILICPYCNSSTIFKNDNLFCSKSTCNKSVDPFKFIDQKPVLVNFENSVISNTNLFAVSGVSMVKRKEGILAEIRKIIQGESRATIENITLLIDKLDLINEPKILIIGGGEIGSGFNDFYLKFYKNITSFDIYNSINIDFIADAHVIPLKSDYFDLVVIQAVLEHVLDPHLVVKEIERVLKMGGIVFADTPFMQQVHEGPYDFTRFTESGHRYLFKYFELIKSGFTAGSGTALIWSLSNFFTGLFHARFAGKIVRVLFFWIRFFDKVIPERFNIDGACGVFFIGKKCNNPISQKDIISFYNGAQRPN